MLMDCKGFMDFKDFQDCKDLKEFKDCIVVYSLKKVEGAKMGP